jgi:hypothetical protein
MWVVMQKRVSATLQGEPGCLWACLSTPSGLCSNFLSTSPLHHFHANPRKSFADQSLSIFLTQIFLFVRVWLDFSVG